jgi:tRNA pseudouridine55 synthase
VTSNGLLVLDKPLGMSSRQALDRVRRRYRTRKAGFAGTLDPLASGVLVCALGVATRLLTYLEGDAKRYRAIVELGRETDTDDAEGRTVAQGDWHAVGRAQVDAALVAFRGPLRQRPPAYSAISIGGQRLYALARRGEAVVAPEREVTIYALDLTDWRPPQFALDVRCSKGTYIRALARDLGRTLGCYAYLAGLRRTASGAFTLDQATTLEQLEAAGDDRLATYLLPPRAAVAHLPAIALEPDEVGRVRSGQRLRRSEAGDGLTALLDSDGIVVGVGRSVAGTIQPEKVLPPPDEA